MSTCKDCKHWDSKFPNNEGIDGLGNCGAVVQLIHATEFISDCDQHYDVVIRPEHEGSTSFVKDASDYHAQLLTLGEFGCNRFESKRED